MDSQPRNIPLVHLQPFLYFLCCPSPSPRGALFPVSISMIIDIPSNSQVHTHTHTHTHAHGANAADSGWHLANEALLIHHSLSSSTPQSDWPELEIAGERPLSICSCVSCVHRSDFVWCILSLHKLKPASYVTTYFGRLGRHLAWKTTTICGWKWLVSL